MVRPGVNGVSRGMLRISVAFLIRFIVETSVLPTLCYFAAELPGSHPKQVIRARLDDFPVGAQAGIL